MKARIITGAVGLPIAALIVLFAPDMLVYSLVAVICVVSVYEVLKATHHTDIKGVLMFSLLYAISAPFFRLQESFYPAFIITFVYALCMCLMQLKYHERLKITDIALSFFLTVIYSVGFSCIGYLATADARAGRFYLALGIVITWMCDIGAYFAGTFFGKRKLCPKISPKKTVEGFIGGLIISALSAVLISLAFQFIAFKDTYTINCLMVAVVALVCAPLSVLGDLFASVIKRQYDIKDFGKIFPGHGGMVDRFDSFLFTLPLLYLLVMKMPIIS